MPLFWPLSPRELLFLKYALDFIWQTKPQDLIMTYLHQSCQSILVLWQLLLFLCLLCYSRTVHKRLWSVPLLVQNFWLFRLLFYEVIQLWFYDFMKYNLFLDNKNWIFEHVCCNMDILPYFPGSWKLLFENDNCND